MLSFIAALYNEEQEVLSLLEHVSGFVDGIYLADDGSTDDTLKIVADELEWNFFGPPIVWTELDHTGLPETVKNEALQLVPEGSWVLLLDADERFAPGVLNKVKDWLTTEEAIFYSHVYFSQVEILDGVPVRHFQKSKLFKKEAVTFPSGIHEDDRFEGHGTYKPEWVVHHRKSSGKQRLREEEYLETYKKLYEDGKIDLGRYDWLRNLHHFNKGNSLDV